MLTRRLIATILLNNGMIVQSKQFKHTNIIGSASTAIDFFNSWGIDEIVILDVSRTDENHKEFLKIIEDFGNKCFIPLAVGGWIRTTDDIKDCLNAGADKVIMNTQAYLNNDFISEAAQKFGSQCIVVSIDVKNGTVHIDRGRKDTNAIPELWANLVQQLGAGEIYLTSITQDGMGQGYDLDLIKRITKDAVVPVIASGGCGKWEHLKEALDVGADAVSIANLLHYSEHSVYNFKKKLYENGINVRPPEFWTETKI